MPNPRKSFEDSALQRAFGDRVREIRTARGWTQEVLADRASMDRSYVAQVETGQRNISLRAIAKIANGLQVEIADLFR